MKYILIILCSLISFEVIPCECVSHKSFLAHIKYASLVIYGEVVDSVFTLWANNMIHKEEIAIKVLNSFGANRENDTIWIKGGGGLDCIESVQHFRYKCNYYFALYESDSDKNKYSISVCGTHYLEVDIKNNKAIGEITAMDRIISSIMYFFHIYKYDNKMIMNKLNMKIFKKKLKFTQPNST